MSDLLLELFSEEIPARMQAQAAEDLRKLVTDALVKAGVTYSGARAFVTPRRLALAVSGLPARQPDTREARKGPRVDAPEGAIAGFVKSAGLASIAQAKIETDPKKGEFYVAVIEKSGRPTPEVLSEILPEILRAFPWPKSMRWGEPSAKPGAARWVRPLRGIVATFGSETETPEVIPFTFAGVSAGATTQGHRFMAPEPFGVKRFDDYAAGLERAQVVLDAQRRKDIIRADAQTLAFAQGLEVVADEGLLEEVAGLVEWPVVLMGSFDEAFLDVPDQVIRATIRANQKCFVLRKVDGRLANRFLLVANLAARDGGKTIIAGNERVIRARLSDAKFFWETDKKVWDGYKDQARLEAALKRFENVTFHEKLGSQRARIARIGALAQALCPLTGADAALVDRAALLCKLDLQTEVVGEFPEVQGLMGRKYAALIGEAASVAAACEEHYKPIGPNDSVPTDKVSVTLALADKLDTLVGFWAIDEKPTGSKDPYALRRAALGVIRLVVENGISLPLLDAFNHAARGHGKAAHGKAVHGEDLLAFFQDRLKVMLRDLGARHDLVDAVLGAPGTKDDLLAITRRVTALGVFIDSENGASLLAGVKRAGNILRAEEKKDGAGAFEAAPEESLLEAPEERALQAGLAALEQVLAETRTAGSSAQDAQNAARLTAIAALRAPVDAFFEAVLVNADPPALRLNRLRLLARLRRATLALADFTRIGG